MDEQLHIIIAGEAGGSRTIPFTRKKFYITISSTAIILTGLVTGCFFATKHSVENKLMASKIVKLEQAIDQISSERKQLKQKIAAINENNSRSINELQVQHDLETTSLKLENAKLISSAVSELNERSELIEHVMANVGVKLKKQEVRDNDKSNEGGVFIPAEQGPSYNQLLERADNYLSTIRSIPIGRPINGDITSRYGTRTDPLNDANAFHTGVDIRGKKGDKIYATAAGVVTKSFRNGGYGNFIEIDHGNGYKTRFAHLQNYIVKKGEHVKRGQIIGQVGNTGRSTGPHLHYEILLGNKTVNPSKFMKIADLSHTFTYTSEN